MIRTLALVAGVAACAKHRESFGSFDTVKRDVVALDCQEKTAEKDAAPGVMHCELIPKAVNDKGAVTLGECTCTGSMAIHRASTETEVDRIDLTVAHCDHAMIVQTATRYLQQFVSSDARAMLTHAVDNPGGGAVGAMYVTSKRKLGDVTLDLNWSRDVFKAATGAPVPESTETLTVSISPAKSSDEERNNVSKDAHVTGRPTCN